MASNKEVPAVKRRPGRPKGTGKHQQAPVVEATQNMKIREAYVASSKQGEKNRLRTVGEILADAIKIIQDNQTHIGSVSFVLIAKEGDAMVVEGRAMDGVSARFSANAGYANTLTLKLMELARMDEADNSEEDLASMIDKGRA